MTARAAPTAVLDTNLLVSGLLSPSGVPRRVLDLFREQSAQVALTPALRAEYFEVVQRQWLVEQCSVQGVDPVEFLTALLSDSLPVQPAGNLPVLVRDPKDAMVLAAALGGQVDYLITGDNDLLVLAEHPAIQPLKIIRANAFLEVVESPQ